MHSKIIIGPECIGKHFMADILQKQGYSTIVLENDIFQWKHPIQKGRPSFKNKRKNYEEGELNPDYPSNMIKRIIDLNGSTDFIFVEYTSEILELISAEDLLVNSNILVVLPHRNSLMEYLGRYYAKHIIGDGKVSTFTLDDTAAMVDIYDGWSKRTTAVLYETKSKNLNYAILKTGYYVYDLFCTENAVDSSNLDNTCVFNMLHLNN